MRHYFNDGTFIDFTEDKLSDFQFERLLYNIGYESRFANQIEYSVLEHSIAVGRAAEMMFAGNVLLVQHAYLHDLGEAIYRDVPTPIKEMVGPKWYNMEKMISKKLMDYLGVGELGDDDAKYLTYLDKTMAYVEATNFFAPQFAELLKTKTELLPEYVVACTTAFNSVTHMDIWLESGMLNPDITNLYKQIIFAKIL